MGIILSVGLPRIELGLYAPEAHVLPVYYSPFIYLLGWVAAGVYPCLETSRTCWLLYSPNIENITLIWPKKQENRRRY